MGGEFGEDKDGKSSQGKIDISVAGIQFSGEGDQDWLALQLEKILKAGVELGSGAKPSQSSVASAPGIAGTTFTSTLASHIRAKGGESNQVKRFLATADWLRLRGEQTLTTLKVTKALTDNHQKRLSNPADCLNSNVSKGHCEKANGGFYITPEGMKELGYDT